VPVPALLPGRRAVRAPGHRRGRPIDDERAQPALAWILARQDARGRWSGHASYADRMPSRIDASKWVTLQAATLLKHAFGDAA